MFYYPSVIEIPPLAEPPHAMIPVPGSKSITNRALIMAALADGESVISGALDSDDTRVMADALLRLGFEVEWAEGSEYIRVAGRAGRIPAGDAELFVGNSGTSARFLAALCALGSGCYRIDGVPRMRERPQLALLQALNSLGVEARSENGDGCAPLIIRSGGAIAGGSVTINAEASSQFLTALMLIAPYAAEPVSISVVGSLRPSYIEITQRMMQAWGADLTWERPSRDGQLHQLQISTANAYRAQAGYRVEPDASSASYFFAAAAVSGGTVTVPGLTGEALQGDVRFATEVLSRMGCIVTQSIGGTTVFGAEKLKGIDVDMSAISDTSLTLAAISPFASTPTTIRNIAHARLQECDRVSAACTELGRLGVKVTERPDGLTIHPAEQLDRALIRTYNDHRVAMSFAITGLAAPGIIIDNPACVAKTFPGYWMALDALR